MTAEREPQRAPDVDFRHVEAEASAELSIGIEARPGLVHTHEMPDLFDLLFRPASHDELPALAWPFAVFHFEKVQDRLNKNLGAARRLRRSLLGVHVSQEPFARSSEYLDTWT